MKEYILKARALSERDNLLCVIPFHVVVDRSYIVSNDLVSLGLVKN